MNWTWRNAVIGTTEFDVCRFIIGIHGWCMYIMILPNIFPNKYNQKPKVKDQFGWNSWCYELYALTVWTKSNIFTYRLRLHYYIIIIIISEWYIFGTIFNSNQSSVYIIHFICEIKFCLMWLAIWHASILSNKCSNCLAVELLSFKYA